MTAAVGASVTKPPGWQLSSLHVSSRSELTECTAKACSDDCPYSGATGYVTTQGQSGTKRLSTRPKQHRSGEAPIIGTPRLPGESPWAAKKFRKRSASCHPFERPWPLVVCENGLGILGRHERRRREACGADLGRKSAGGLLARLRRPATLFWLLFLTSACAYLPLAVAFDPGSWASLGPFSFQVSRPLLYAVYFFVGAGLGAAGPSAGLFTSGGRMARRWSLWAMSSVGAFLVTVGCFLWALSRGAAAGKGPWAAVDVSFALSCAASSFAFLALFVRFARRGRIGDSLASNAYGMYITHYPLVSWLQYALLGSTLAGAAKGTLVFGGAVASSWLLTAGLRRIPAVGAVLSTSLLEHRARGLTSAWPDKPPDLETRCLLLASAHRTLGAWSGLAGVPLK